MEFHEDDMKKTDYQCDFCGKYLSNKKKYRHHISLVHMGLLHSICDICGYKAKHKEGMKIHILKHTEK